MSPRRDGELATREREHRRFMAQAEHLRRQHGISLKLATRMVREDDRRSSRMVAGIRAEVRKALHDTRAVRS